MLGLFFQVALFVFGWYFLLHFGKDLPERYREIAQSRERFRAALGDSKKDAVTLQEEYRGDLLAFAVVSGITVIVAVHIARTTLRVLSMLGSG